MERMNFVKTRDVEIQNLKYFWKFARKAAHNIRSMLDYRNSIQIVNVTNFSLTMKLLAMYTAPNVFI